MKKYNIIKFKVTRIHTKNIKIVQGIAKKNSRQKIEI